MIDPGTWAGSGAAGSDARGTRMARFAGVRVKAPAIGRPRHHSKPQGRGTGYKVWGGPRIRRQIRAHEAASRQTLGMQTSNQVQEDAHRGSEQKSWQPLFV